MTGDLNVKIGMVNSEYERMDERPEYLCAFNNMVISDIFPHRRMYDARQVSLNLATEIKINHIGTNRKFRRFIGNVKKSGADIASNHHLVVPNNRTSITTEV